MTLLSDYKIKYITDDTGKRQEVVIAFNAWRTINEELESLREKHKFLEGLKQACTEAKMQESGDLPEQNLEDFLNEL
jgi:hypothetical protein